MGECVLIGSLDEGTLFEGAMGIPSLLQVACNKAKGYVCVLSIRSPSSKHAVPLNPCGRLPEHAETQATHRS